MTFTLNTFKREINATILRRGCEYFHNDQVVALEEVGQGSWSASVAGGDQYEVKISQDEHQLLACHCNCLYDRDPICKHIAAVLYAIEDGFPEYFDKTSRKTRQPAKKRRSRHDRVMAILKELSKDTLIEVLGEIARRDRQITNLIVARFSNESPDKKMYERMINDILRSVQDRGFIDYRGSNRAGHDIHELIEQAGSDLKQGQLAKAIVIYQAVIETVVPVIEHADDSNGLLGDCIEAALDGLRTVSKNLSKPEQGRLFDYCVSEAFESRYKGWDWCWTLAQIAADLVTASDNRVRLFELLDKMVNRSQRSNAQYGWSNDFDKQRAEAIKFSVIERLGDPEQIYVFLVDHLEMEHFREKLVNFYIEQGELEKAKSLGHE